MSLTSDFICGFCSETEQQFQETLDLIDKVGYDQAYLFAYSMRPNTFAYLMLKGMREAKPGSRSPILRLPVFPLFPSGVQALGALPELPLL